MTTKKIYSYFYKYSNDYSKGSGIVESKEGPADAFRSIKKLLCEKLNSTNFSIDEFRPV